MLFKNFLVFIHLIAMALAVARMLEFDLRFLRTAHRPLSAEMRQELARTQRLMSLTLAVLWASGLGLVALAAAQDPQALRNEKLWMKGLTVLCLTLNGLILHRVAFPVLQGPQAFLALPWRARTGLTLCAVMSSVSWLFASFLGIARSWNHTATFPQLLTLYLSLLLLAGAAALGLLAVMAPSGRGARSPEREGSAPGAMQDDGLTQCAVPSRGPKAQMPAAP